MTHIHHTLAPSTPLSLTLSYLLLTLSPLCNSTLPLTPHCHIYPSPFPPPHSSIPSQIYGRPTIVINYPKGIKAFYMKLNDDNETVAAMDILVPKIGELIGGSQRYLLHSASCPVLPSPALPYYDNALSCPPLPPALLCNALLSYPTN